MIVNLEEESKKKKIQIYTSLFNNYELKITFSYKYCDNVYINKEKK